MFESSESLPVTAMSRDQQLAELRARMAQISGKVGAVSRAEVPAIDVIAVPGGIGELLPGGGLARGSVVACRGAGVLAGLLAAVTGGGQQVAVVGGARLGLLAVSEMGGDLSCLYLIDPRRGDPLEVVSVLVDGLPVVVLDVPRLPVPPARARAIVSKLRTHKGVLICTDRTPGFRPDLAIDSRTIEYIGLGPGTGRVREIRKAIEISGRNIRPCRGELVLAAAGEGRTAWTRAGAEAVSPVRRVG